MGASETCIELEIKLDLIFGIVVALIVIVGHHIWWWWYCFIHNCCRCDYTTTAAIRHSSILQAKCLPAEKKGDQEKCETTEQVKTLSIGPESYVKPLVQHENAQFQMSVTNKCSNRKIEVFWMPTRKTEEQFVGILSEADTITQYSSDEYPWVFRDSETGQALLYYVPRRLISVVETHLFSNDEVDKGEGFVKKVHRLVIQDDGSPGVVDMNQLSLIALDDPILPLPSQYSVTTMDLALSWIIRRAIEISTTEKAERDSLLMDLRRISNRPQDPRYEYIQIANFILDSIWDTTAHGLFLVAQSRHNWTMNPDHRTFKVIQNSLKNFISFADHDTIFPPNMQKHNSALPVVERNSQVPFRIRPQCAWKQLATYPARWDPFDVFLIHTGKQKRVEVATLKEKLEQGGFTCFLDMEMKCRDGSPEKYMQHSLQTCRYAVTIVSQEFLQNISPCQELSFAFKRMEWIRSQDYGWESLWVILYHVSVEEYKTACETNPHLPRDMTKHVVLDEYPKQGYKSWPHFYCAFKDNLEEYDKDEGAEEKWHHFLKEGPICADFPSADSIY